GVKRMFDQPVDVAVAGAVVTEQDGAEEHGGLGARGSFGFRVSSFKKRRMFPSRNPKLETRN
ncbi:MAG: hypothetical protein ACYC26_17295, partial [Phycisphaerales bacterium]